MSACKWCGGDEAAGTCPKSIECPDCHAGPGASCVRPSGHRASRLHASRVDRAEQMDRRDDCRECVRCGQRALIRDDVLGICPGCRELERAPQGEALHLFTPAPAVAGASLF